MNQGNLYRDIIVRANREGLEELTRMYEEELNPLAD
jgi:hypothetical protein